VNWYIASAIHPLAVIVRLNGLKTKQLGYIVIAFSLYEKCTSTQFYSVENFGNLRVMNDLSKT
jgi:hypothetical protein